MQPTIEGAPSRYEIEVPLVVPPKVTRSAGVVAPAGMAPLQATTLKVGGQTNVGRALIVKTTGVLLLLHPESVSSNSA